MDDPANSQLVELSFFYAMGTSESAPYPVFPDTNVLAITGPGTAFGDGNQTPMA